MRGGWRMEQGQLLGVSLLPQRTAAPSAASPAAPPGSTHAAQLMGSPLSSVNGQTRLPIPKDSEVALVAEPPSSITELQCHVRAMPVADADKARPPCRPVDSSPTQLLGVAQRRELIARR